MHLAFHITDKPVHTFIPKASPAMTLTVTPSLVVLGMSLSRSSWYAGSIILYFWARLTHNWRPWTSPSPCGISQWTIPRPAVIHCQMFERNIKPLYKKHVFQAELDNHFFFYFILAPVWLRLRSRFQLLLAFSLTFLSYYYQYCNQILYCLQWIFMSYFPYICCSKPVECCKKYFYNNQNRMTACIQKEILQISNNLANSWIKVKMNTC